MPKNIFEKEYHIVPQGKFWGKKGVILILFIIIISSHLYTAILNEEGFWRTFWFLFIFVLYISLDVWLDEEKDKSGLKK